MVELVLRVVALCLALAGAETLHGIARVRLLVPRVGRRRAQQVSIVTGSALAFGVCWLLVPSLGLRQPGQLLALGLFLAAFMAAFDVAVARALGRRWADVAADFDPRRGNYLVLGLLTLVLAPYAVTALAARG